MRSAASALAVLVTLALAACDASVAESATIVAASAAASATPTVETPEPAATTPSPRGYHALVDLPGEPGVLVTGGSEAPGPTGLPETWYLEIEAGWRRIATEGSPPFGEAVILHTPSGRIVSFVGRDISIFDPRAEVWELRTHDDGPRRLIGTRAAYDSQSDRAILFGGWQRTDSDETWAYDFETDAWELMSPAESPSGRNFVSMTYDVQSDRVILFGGGTDLESFGDTWAYDYEADAWEELTPADSPTASSYGAMEYDPATDRAILFGGTYGTFLSEDALDETWAFDYETATWTNLEPATSPSPRGWHAMALDAESGVIVLFGGGPLRQEYTDEVWRYDPAANTWKEIEVGP